MIKITSSNLKIWSRLGPSAAFGAAVMSLRETYPNLMMLTADLSVFSGLERFRKKWPESFVNVGIAEQNLMGMAAGMAAEGFMPFVSSYASFVTARCLDQLRMSMGYMRLPVKTVGFASGFAAGLLGPSHTALDDLAMLQVVPNLAILCPCDCTQIVRLTACAAEYDGPAYIRLSGNAPMDKIYSEDCQFTLGKAVRLGEKDDCEIEIIAQGSILAEVLKAVALIKSQSGLKVGLTDMHTLRPFDSQCLKELASHAKLLVSVEEHSVHGGLGSSVAEILSANSDKPPLLMLGADGFYPKASSYPTLLAQAGLSADKIASKVIASFEKLI